MKPNTHRTDSKTRLFSNKLSVALSRLKDTPNAIDDTGIVALDKAHLQPDLVGKNAARLGQLMEAGYNVSHGLVLTTAITHRLYAQPAQPMLNSSESRTLNRLWKRLSIKQATLSHSGSNITGEQNRFALVHGSAIGVTRDSLESAVRQLCRSTTSTDTSTYTQESLTSAHSGNVDQGSVIVQKTINTEYSGVMVTEHPNTSGAMMIEMLAQTGEILTSVSLTPDTYTYGKITGELLLEASSFDKPAPIDLAPLQVLGNELENHFAHPQHIEWAYSGGKFYLLQVRDISRSVSTGNSLRHLAESERSKLLKNLHGKLRADKIKPTDPVFVQNELSQLLPRPTPLSADLMQRLWAAGGSIDLASQDLGVPYKVDRNCTPCINTIFGWLYVNQHELKRRRGKGAGAKATFQLGRNAQSIEARFRDEFLPGFQSDMIERSSIATELLSLESAIDLFSTWIKHFVEQTHYEVERINIAADFHINVALEKLNDAELEPAPYLEHHLESVVSGAMLPLKGDNINAQTIDEFLLTFGHRAPVDYELAAPRFAEDLNLIRQIIEKQTNEDSEAPGENVIQLLDSKALKISIQKARAFTRLKEEAKHFCLIELAQIRRLLVTIDNKLQLDGRVFHLSIDEVAALSNAVIRPQLLRVAEERFEAAMAWKSVQPPASLSIRELERIDMLTGVEPDTTAQGELHGKRVAGQKEVVGSVRVITDIEQMSTFKKGEILVTETISALCYQLFPQARGIICEAGGWLSDAAVVARDFDLPAIVGVSQACRTLKTGDVVRMSMSGALELMNNRRVQNPVAAAAEADDLLTQECEDTEEEETAQQNIYKLTEHKLFRYSQNVERRAMKERVTDRRSEPRYNENGELQADRRLSNRQANAEKLRKAG